MLEYVGWSFWINTGLLNGLLLSNNRKCSAGIAMTPMTQQPLDQMDPIKANIIIEPSFDSDLVFGRRFRAAANDWQNLPLHLNNTISASLVMIVLSLWEPKEKKIVLECHYANHQQLHLSSSAKRRAASLFSASNVIAAETLLSGPQTLWKGQWPLTPAGQNCFNEFAWNLCGEFWNLCGTALPKNKHSKKNSHIFRMALLIICIISDNALQDKSREHLRWTCAHTRVVEAAPQDAHTIRCLRMSETWIWTGPSSSEYPKIRMPETKHFSHSGRELRLYYQTVNPCKS